MSFNPFAVAIVAIVMVFGVGAIAVVTEHFQKMAKIRANAEGKDRKAITEAIEDLRRELCDLRDTTTKYDMSFDSALQRLESRMNHMEQRADGNERTDSRTTVQAG